MSEWLAAASGPAGVGDPGRVHSEGRHARGTIELARAQVASLFATEGSRVVFTSGATEAANTAVAAAAALRPGAPLVAAAVEHSCVREACRRVGPVLEPAVDSAGRIDLDELAEMVRSPTRPALVNCQLANHEVGTLQDLAGVLGICRQGGVPVHVDAAAAAGHIELDFETIGADYMSVSAHKLGGPPGIGALVLRRGLRLAPLLVGGSEERGRRAGGENVIGILGFGAACEALSVDGRLVTEGAAARGLTDELLAAAVAVEGVRQVGDPSRRVPHIVAVTVEGVLGEAVLLSLDRAGVAAHSGSACSSEILEPSPVLAAMGADPDSSLRLSVGWSSTQTDVTAFAEEFPQCVRRLRALAAGEPAVPTR